MDEFRRITEKALNFVFLLATPLTLYFMLFAKEGIFFLSGPEYSGAVVPMQIIMPTLLFIGITNILGIQILVPLKKEKVVLYSEIAGAVVDVIINVILIPKYVSAGAAIGTLVAEFVVLLVQYYALRSEVTSVFKRISYWKIGLALIFASVASLWVKGLDIGTFFTLVISAVLFFAVYGLFLWVSKESLIVEMFNQVIGWFGSRMSPNRR